MSYQIYKHARDAAWKTLINCKISSLPVDMGKICEALGYHLYSYRSAEKIIKQFHLEKQCQLSDGFTMRFPHGTYIYYSDACTPGRQRFTVAHEVGHLVLGHVQARCYTTHNSEPSHSDCRAEQQANIFAARLLAPACVLHALGITSAEEISRVCYISMQAAQTRAARIAVLDQRDRYLSHPLERQLFAQFKDFLSAR